MARTKQTARKSTGDKAPRPVVASNNNNNPFEKTNFNRSGSDDSEDDHNENPSPFTLPLMAAKKTKAAPIAKRAKTAQKVVGITITKPRRKRGNYESFGTFIYKVLKQVHPDQGISQKAMQIMNSMMFDLLSKFTNEATFLADMLNKKTVSSREVQTAVRLILPGELAKHAVSESTKAICKFQAVLFGEANTGVAIQPTTQPVFVLPTTSTSLNPQPAPNQFGFVAPTPFALNTAQPTTSPKREEDDDDSNEEKGPIKRKRVLKKAKKSAAPKPPKAAGSLSSRSQRAGLQFPVSRIGRLMKKKTDKRIGKGAPIYAAATLEYLCAEVLELAGNASRDNNRNRIIPRHISLAVGNDAELSRLFKDVIFPSAGVIPNIHAVLIPRRAMEPQQQYSGEPGDDDMSQQY